MTVTAFRLYYSDGSFSSEDGTWDEAPSEDVQVLTYWTKDGPTLSHGQDEPYTIPGETSEKRGSYTSEQNFERILQRAYEDVR